MYITTKYTGNVRYINSFQINAYLPTFPSIFARNALLIQYGIFRYRIQATFLIMLKVLNYRHIKYAARNLYHKAQILLKSGRFIKEEKYILLTTHILI